MSEELASLPLPERITAVIERSGMGQERFADTYGFPRETVSRWVNGHARPNRASRPKLAAAATEILKEDVRPDLFRDYPPGRPRPLEEAARDLALASRALEGALQDLIGLLAEQRSVVARLEEAASRISEPSPDDAGDGGSL